MNVSSLGRNGVHDYLLVRASAVIIALYSFLLTAYFIMTPELNYAHWTSFFQNPIVKVATLLTLIALLVHAWIGTWQVLTDYVKPVVLRGSLQVLCIITLIVYVIYGNMVIWSI